MQPICVICGAPGRACGDSHMTGPVVDLPPDKGDPAMSEPMELNEYTYYVGHVPTTAMLTSEQAERLGAKPVGEELDPTEVGNMPNTESERMATRGREADDAGVNATHSDGTTSADTTEKARTARNKRAS